MDNTPGASCFTLNVSSANVSFSPNELVTPRPSPPSTSPVWNQPSRTTLCTRHPSYVLRAPGSSSSAPQVVPRTNALKLAHVLGATSVKSSTSSVPCVVPSTATSKAQYSRPVFSATPLMCVLASRS